MGDGRLLADPSAVSVQLSHPGQGAVPLSAGFQEPPVFWGKIGASFPPATLVLLREWGVGVMLRDLPKTLLAPLLFQG